MPCAACFNRHKTVERELQSSPERRRQIEQAVGFNYSRFELLCELCWRYCMTRLDLDSNPRSCHRPICAGFKVVAYYGCLLVRPPEVTNFDDPEHPS